MGLFSAKKKTYVSSVVYPLGEDGKDRTDMLKTAMINGVLQGKGIADSIQETFLRGQGLSLRSAFSYARDKYTDGLPTSAARFADQADLTALKNVLLSLNSGKSISFITTLIGTADFEWWGLRYLADTYGYDQVLGQFNAPPKGVEASANVAYDLEPNGSINILLMNANGASVTLNYRPSDYTSMANYVHSAYQTQQTFDGGTTTSTRAATPGEIGSTVYASSTVYRTGETQLTTTKTVVSISGSTATVTVSKTTEVTSRPVYFLYRLGSGKYPSLDSQLATNNLSVPYFPAVPLRVDNKSVVDKASEGTPLYKTSKKLLSKVGLDIADLGSKVDTNKDVSEIDYCFVTFGVRLKTDSPEGMKYLFRFFSYLRSISEVGSSAYNVWLADYRAKFPNGPDPSTLPPGGVAAPPVNSIEIYSAKDRANNHDIKLQWQYIDTQLITGTVSPNAKPGTCTVSLSGPKVELDLLNDIVMEGSLLHVCRQVDDNTYEQLTISGLTYENFIYAGKSVIITAHDALTDDAEEGFIIPLNQEIIRATPMVEVTNLSYQCMFMVFNCYKVVKQKWYQTTLFKIIIVIIAIVIIVVSWGAATPAATGMVGAAFAAAAALGLVAGTLLFTIVAATLYVLSMMVLMSILMKISVKAFGAKWGPIIATVIAVMSSNYASSGSVFGAAGSNASLITAQNVIQASSSLASVYIQDKLKDISKDTAKLESDYTTGMAKIDQLTDELLSTHLNEIDVAGFTNATFHMIYEQPDTFLNRTLMTGSDVCSITQGLVENFVDVGLRLPTTG